MQPKIFNKILEKANNALEFFFFQECNGSKVDGHGID
jgi:hypothetical protein